MAEIQIHTLDLKFQGRENTIASYLIRFDGGVALIESGPGSTVPALEAALAEHNLKVQDVTHVFLTHIHLDHAGASGYLALQGATVYVHPNGERHMLNPEVLIASATRIYGDRMDGLWGQFLPVPREKLVVAHGGEEIVLGNLRILPLDTPGHAEHHFCYLVDDLLFTGDVGGVRIPGYPYMRVPMPPPELHIEKWRASLDEMRRVAPKRIAPTHFGIFDDPDWHFDMVEKCLGSAERWLEDVMPRELPIDDLRASFTEWAEAEGIAMGLDPVVVKAYQLANPLGMSADGLLRYWRKFRTPQA